MSFLGGKERFQPYKIAAYIPVKFFLRPDRALSALIRLTLTSLTWGPHPLPMGLSFCLGCIAGVPASSCGTAVDVSGQGPTPNLASCPQSCSAMALPRHTLGCVWPWLHSLGLILNPTDILLAWPGLSPSPSLSPGRCPVLGAGATPCAPPTLLLTGGGMGLARRSPSCCPHGDLPQLPVPWLQLAPVAPCPLSLAVSSPRLASQS